ncbi:hypothetical protein [Plantactinospora sp. BC1]|uniref:hypothetical protein n=1 Tax=Plantactinospora sp. BC1 TaxID=2108470 RepID=UPI00131F0083|nr:hypothetical protein [Plantactinospora sp. BC1]
MTDSDDLIRTVGELLARGERPVELRWPGVMYDDGRLVYRVTVVDWPRGRDGGTVKVVVQCANQYATFGVSHHPLPEVARYLDLSPKQRSRGWSRYDGDPTQDRGIWIHLAWTVRRLREAFDVLELHREYDGSFGLLIGPGPAATT